MPKGAIIGIQIQIKRKNILYAYEAEGFIFVPRKQECIIFKESFVLILGQIIGIY